MPMTYRIDREARLVRIEGRGRLTDDEMVQCISSLRSDPELEPDMQTLSDMRDVEVDFNTEGVMRMLDVMARTAEKRSSVRAAIVVNSTVAYGMGRMLEMRAEEQSDPVFQIFRDMQAACEWLGIEAEHRPE